MRQLLHKKRNQQTVTFMASYFTQSSGDVDLRVM